METMILAAGIVGVSLVIATLVHTVGRMRIEQQKMLRKLLEQGGSPQDVVSVLRSSGALHADKRRGLLLLALGLSWSVSTFFIGGIAWVFGAVPVAIGLVYLLFGTFDAADR